MAARLIETTEEDSFLVVAKYIGDLLDGGQVRGQRCVSLGAVNRAYGSVHWIFIQ